MAQITARGGEFRVLQKIRCYRFKAGWSDLKAGTTFTFPDRAGGMRFGRENFFKVKTSAGEEIYLPERSFVTEKLDEVVST